MRQRLQPEALFGALGYAAGPAFGLAARLRGARALHPRGAVVSARLVRVGHRPTGVAWLDDADDRDVVVRLSRSVGLAPPLPDVLGLALRCPLDDGRFGDLLLSSSLAAPVGRHLLLPRRDAHRTGYSCLVPYDTRSGPLMVGALPSSDRRLRLVHASPMGPWHVFGHLTLRSLTGPDDPGLDLDPVLNPLPGLRVPDALRRLREPAYRRSRLERRRSLHSDPAS